jgi:hypothetical protein
MVEALHCLLLHSIYSDAYKCAAQRAMMVMVGRGVWFQQLVSCSAKLPLEAGSCADVHYCAYACDGGVVLTV